MNKLIKFIFFITSITNHVSGNEEFKKGLDNILTSFNSSVNTSSAEIYNSQRAGYATGGSLVLRNQLYDTKIANVTFPKIDAGCGGIDIFMGGFSFVNSEQLVDTLKNIGAAAKGYAFMIGVEAVSPMVLNNMARLQSWANTINGMGINSCENAQGLIGSILPRNQAYDQHICNSLATTGKVYRDFVSARHQCAVQTYNPEIVDAATKNQTLIDYNVVWEAIKKHDSLSSDHVKSDLIMSLLGTIIVRKTQSDDSKIVYHPSKISDENFIFKLMNGGNITLLNCSKDERIQCLSLSEKDLVLDYKDSWVGKTKQQLLSIQNKAINDESLSAEEINFIARSRLPLYKIVNVLSAKKRSFAGIDLLQLSEYVAKDMLSYYLRDIINVVRAGCQEVKLKQFFGAEIDDYLQELVRVENVLNQYELRSRNQYATEIDVMRNIQFLEDQIFSEINLN